MIDPQEAAMIGQALAVQVRLVHPAVETNDRLVVVKNVHVRIAQAAIGLIDPRVVATIGQARLVHTAVGKIAQAVVEMTVRVQVGHSAVATNARREVEMIAQVRVVHPGLAMIDFHQVGHVGTMIVHRAVVMIDHLVVEKNVHVRIVQIRAVPTEVAMIAQVAVVMIAAMLRRVRKPPRSERPMKFIIAPVVESTARNRCPPPNTRLSVGAMTGR